MSEPMKRPPIEALTITIRSKRKSRCFVVPKAKAQGLVHLIGDYEVEPDYSISSDDIFSDLNEKYTKPGALLRGARFKEGLSQKELARRLGIPQSHISEMEHGKRPIGKKMSQRLSKVLKLNYKIFL